MILGHAATREPSRLSEKSTSDHAVICGARVDVEILPVDPDTIRLFPSTARESTGPECPLNTPADDQPCAQDAGGVRC
jgi:hypothetical protein